MAHFVNHTAFDIHHSLVIGCGGRGTEIVAHCRQRILSGLFQNDEKTLNECTALQFLVFDSAEQNLESNNSSHGITTIPIACNDLGEIIASRDGKYPDTPNGVIHIKRQMPYKNYARMIRGLPNASMGNSTCPPLGAMNFTGSWAKIENHLRGILEKWIQPCTLSSSINIRPFSEFNQVFISAGLYGGTGCGIHLHVAAMVRNLLKKMEINNTAVYAFFLLPDLVANPDETGKRKLRANAYAALKEIDHFVSGNPFIIKTGANIDDIVVSNQKENDVLFNKIFLVNDENIEGVVLDLNEAEKMAGEAIFHFSATNMGRYINARLTDSPHEYTTMYAPDGASDSFNTKRLRAYSTFGMATTRIPYATLKNNLITDFATEILNECIMLPDDDSKQEQEKLNKTKKWFHSKYIDIPDPLSHIQLDNFSLEVLANDQVPLPGFLRNKGGRSFSDYMKKTKSCFEDVLSALDRETHQSLENWENKNDEFTQVIDAYNQIIDGFQKQLINEGAGSSQVEKILKELLTYVTTNQENLIQINHQNIPREELNEFILDRLKKLIQLQESKRIPFLKEKRLKDAEKLYKGLIAKIRQYRDVIQQEFIIALLKKVKIRLEMNIGKTREKKDRFNLILDHLSNNDSVYESSRLTLNAVPVDLLNRFIRQFPYQTGSRPEDLAEKIKAEGLYLDEDTTAKISDFPDYYPERIASALLNVARKTINTTTDMESWQKPFSQSGMFPKPGVDLDWQTKGIDINAYERTMHELVKHSAPYLEYSSLKGFDVCRENIFIHPQNDSIANECTLWQKQTLPMGRNFWLPSESPHGAYSLSCIQFHYGIPLYSIDKFQEWKEAYDYMAKCTDRPLHKFDDTPMREPYVEIGKINIDKGMIKSLFNWALEISKTHYPIFLNCSGIPILDMLDNKEVLSFYFKTHTEQFKSQFEFEEILSAHHDLSAALLQKVQVLANRYGNLSIKDYMHCNDPSIKAKLIAQKLISYSDESPGGKEQAFFEIRKDEKEQSLFWLNSSGYEEKISDTIHKNFYLKMDTPELKDTSLEPSDILAKIEKNAWFQNLFWEKCQEAHDNLFKMGCVDFSHEIFKDSE